MNLDFAAAVYFVLRWSKIPARQILRFELGLGLIPVAVSAAVQGPLPVPSSNFVTAGSAKSPVVVGNTMNVTQSSPNASLDWQSFNINHGYTVNFMQPSSAAVAINEIHQANPVLIQGALNANGQIYLINQNGIVFGAGAQVDTHALLASTLDITATALQKGIVNAFNQGGAIQPAFTAVLDGQGHPINGDVTVAAGASLQTSGTGGQILLFGPNVTNLGTINAPGGTAALAAGSKIYIQTPTTGTGLVVEVGNGGTVTNGSAANAQITNPSALLGQIVADGGTASLVGLAVNQMGRVTASTAVRQNGTIRLLARESTPSGSVVSPSRGGVVTIGQNSVTAADPDMNDTSTTLDANPQPAGVVDVRGAQIVLKKDGLVDSRSGNVKLIAAGDGSDVPVKGDGSRVLLESGAKIDTSGERVALPAGRNALTVKLETAALENLPVQRQGPLLGQTITVDVRQHGTNADGTTWVGTPLADLNSALGNIGRTVGERSTHGGTVSLDGDSVILAPGAVLNVGGGSTQYANGPVQTTMLFNNGKITDIASANPNVAYSIYGTERVMHPKWGGLDTYSVFYSGNDILGGSGAGYTSGADAGTINVQGYGLILDGTLFGGTLPGTLQRLPASLRLAPGAVRPYDQLPLAGALLIGASIAEQLNAAVPDFVTGSVTIAPVTELTAPGLANFDPLFDVFPASITSTYINPGWFGNGKLGQLAIYSDGAVSLPTGTTLDLGPGGTLVVKAGDIALAGNLVAQGGAVTLSARNTADQVRTGSLTLSPTALIDVSGQWVNDFVAARTTPGAGSPPLVLNGGNISLTAHEALPGQGGLNLFAGSVLRVDAGAELSLNGKISSGAGGSIGLSATPVAGTQNVSSIFDATLSAYGLSSGGSLSVTAPAICFSALSCATAPIAPIVFQPAFLHTGGFSAYSFTAVGGALTVESGTTLFPEQDNLVLSPLAQSTTGLELSQVSHLARLADFARQPVNLSLRDRINGNLAGVVTDASLRAGSFLNVERGTKIIGDPGATLSFASDTRAYLNGAVTTPGGNINVSITSGIGINIGDFLASQTLWLGPQATLDTHGVYIAQPIETNLRTGVVWGGGNVNLSALSGYLVAEPGALIDVRGTRAVLDISPYGVGTSLGSVPTLVASNSGSIVLDAAEGIFFGGTINAGPTMPSSGAGALSVQLNAQTSNYLAYEQSGLTGVALPVAPRTLHIMDANPFQNSSAGALRLQADPQTTYALSPGGDVPTTLNGQGFLGTSLLAGASLGDLKLSARNLDLGSVVPGQVLFNGNVSLATSRSITVNSASLASDGGHVQLSAPHVVLGNQDGNLDGTEPGGASQAVSLPQRGTGLLTIVADTIDLVGKAVLNGFSSTHFSASEDIRVSGVQSDPTSPVLTGSLTTTGDLAFAARELYPTTLSQFSLNVVQNSLGVISLDSTAAPEPILSVGGALTLQAPTILQRGTLKAPLGSLTLAASNQLALSAGSLTSTSLDGSTVPFGRVELGKDWVYMLPGSAGELVFTNKTRTLPSQHILLSGPAVTLAAGSVVDESGGGDLLSYEFQPGLSGTKDVLAAGGLANTFAIVPTLHSAYAPIDPQEMSAGPDALGSSLRLETGVAGISAGLYALLPARYALLPGAVLVTSVAGFSDLGAGQQIPALGGGTIVAGRLSSANGSEYASVSSGFLIRTATDIAKLGQYDLHTANAFGGLAGQALPRDGGVLQIQAGSSLALGGILNAAPGSGGVGAEVQITGTSLAVVDGTPSSAISPGALLIDARGLDRLGAASILLGGSRANEGGIDNVTVTAQRVELDAGVAVFAPEVILAATDTVQIDAGATLSGTGAVYGNPLGLRVSGDGAFVRVASAPAVSFARTQVAGLTGSLNMAPGSLLSATGSMLLDSTLDTHLDGALSAHGGAVALSASQISLGAVTGSPAGLTLNDAQLTALNAGSLSLTSRSALDIYGPTILNLQSLALDAVALRGFGNLGDTARIDAQTLTLSDSTSGSALQDGSGAGALAIEVNRLNFGRQLVALSGFAETTLTVHDEIVGTRDTGGMLSRGPLKVFAPRMTTTDGASFSLNSDAALQIFSLAPNPIAGITASGLAGKITLSGASLLFDSTLEVPSGEVSLRATCGGLNAVVCGTTAGDLVLGSHALINVGGQSAQFYDTSAAAPGGTVSLAAASGDVMITSGANLNLAAAAPGGSAGSLTVAASNGQFQLAGTVNDGATTASNSGRFSLDVSTLPNFSGLNAALNAAGFLAERDFHVRGGNLIVSAGDAVKATILNLTADNGAIGIAGKLDASGQQQGGSIRLNALNTIEVLPGGVLDASARGTRGTGGNINLSSITGGILLDSGSATDVSGTLSGGVIHARVSALEALTLTNADPTTYQVALNGIAGASSVVLEAYQTAADLISGLNFAQNWMANNASSVGAGLGAIATNPNFSLVPGVELDVATFTLSNTLDLSTQRFDGAPGVLTVRSAGDLTFNASLTDGFDLSNGSDLATSASPVLLGDRSWSYRLVAGADLSSANLMAVDAGVGNFTIAAGTPGTNTAYTATRPQLVAVRTGTGNIDIAAGGDIVLSNLASVIYTAGRNSLQGRLLGYPGQKGTLGGRPYPIDGGNISLFAAGNIDGVAPGGPISDYSNQLVNNWLFRQGSPSVLTGWTVAPEYFEAGVGALAGGNVSLVAGQDIANMSASVASIGRQIGGPAIAQNNVLVTGGGTLTVDAGTDILSGVFYVGAGTGTLRAGGNIASGRPFSDANSTPLDTILALGDAQFSVIARGPVNIETVINPTLVTQAGAGNRLQKQPTVGTRGNSFFSTYGTNSAVNLTSLTGDVTLDNNGSDLAAAGTFSLFFNAQQGETAALNIYPAIVNTTAFVGNINVNGDFITYPSAAGNLNFLAAQSVNLNNGAQVTVADVNPDSLPTASDPASFMTVVAQNLAAGQLFFNGPPVHQDAATGSVVAHIVAENGNVTGGVGTNNVLSILALSVPTTIYAGGNVVDLNAEIMNVHSADVSQIVAKGSVLYPNSRDNFGRLINDFSGIDILGPGQLTVAAGGDVNLGTSRGITSLGNVSDAALPGGGANVTVLAGVDFEKLNLGTFTQDYLESGSGAQLLTRYMSNLLGLPSLGSGEAISAFAGLPRAAQVPLIAETFFGILRDTGRAAANAGAGANYTNAFTAATSLFAGDSSTGNLNLYFSRIYTLSGGDINLLVPRGGISVGLATAPESFGITKDPSQLGIVAQSTGSVSAYLSQNFEVNESRVFAADGGNILVWSSNGDIDAGRGARAAVSAPPPTISFDANGALVISFPAALTGSGIQALTTTQGRAFGDVDLFAPRGVVNASEAGIQSAGNITIAAVQVLGADNIKAGGTSVGVPTVAAGVSASLAGAGSSANAASKGASDSAASGGRNADDGSQSLGAPSLNMISVEILGFGG